MDVTVKPGPILDGVAPHMKEAFHVYAKSRTQARGCCRRAQDSGAEILVNYLPVGSEKSEILRTTAVDAGCGFVNCIPDS